MAFGTITSTENTFGSVDGTTTGVVPGTLTGSVGVPGPAGPGVPAGGTAGQILQKIDGVDYNTDWVTVNFSATWGSITGTLSDQTDLQTALDGKYSTTNPAGYITSSALSPYLTSATAASTYQTLAGMSSYLTTSAAASTYYLQTNPSGYITSAALAGYATESWVTSGFYPLASNPAGYLTSASLSGYALLSGATFTGTLSAPTPSPGTDSTVVATTEWVKDFDYAPLNSPHFTGNPQAPTPNLADDDTSIATTEFVKGQGYITSSALSPYLLSSTAASTYQTIAGMSSYLTTASAASTYAALAGATFTGVVGFNGASGNVAAKSTGYFKAYTSGAENTDYSLQYDTGLQVVVGGTTVARIALSGILAPSAGITFSDASVQTTAGVSAATVAATYLTQSSAASTYYLQTNPSGYITSAALSGYATESFVTSQGYITSSALTPYLTTATAASTYFTIASAAAKADLASPTFTGTPAAPTASPGTNTTQIATTAFVTAAVPSFASLTEARQFSNTTKVLSPSLALWSMFSADIIYLQRSNFTVTNVGSVQYVNLGSIATETRLAASAASSSRARTFGAGQVDQSQSATVRTNISGILNFSKPTYLAGRSATYDITDPVLTMAFYYGKAEADGVGDLTRRGMGWKVTGGTGSRFLTLQVHNGTTLTSVTSSFAVTGSVAFDWDIISDGAGNVTLYVNGSSVATSSAGPTGLVNLTPVLWQEEYSTSGVPAITFHTAYHSRGRMAVINY